MAEHDFLFGARLIIGYGAITRRIVAALLSAAFATTSDSVKADEGGVSFWLPGTYGSLAAGTQQPGWSMSSVFYHGAESAGGSVVRAREISIGAIPINGQVTVNANLHSDSALGMISATYVLSQPILGGQAAIGLTGSPGVNSTSVSGTLNGSLSRPSGSIPFSRSANIDQSVVGLGDWSPEASLTWSAGVNNYMTYVTAGLPFGNYNSRRLANLGIGHAAIDSGAGYTYSNDDTGHEFSAVLGLTYNFSNPSTQYQSGVDLHLDWGASQFLNEQLFVGAVGYAYREIGCDSGAGDRVGCFQSQVMGVGPQIGYIFPVGTMEGYLNLRGYGEFAAMNRPDGWNVLLTFSISPAPPSSNPHKS
jgi:hypothetical protein